VCAAHEVLCVLLLCVGLTWSAAQAADSPYPENLKNTQDPKDIPTAPLDALRQVTVPPGFSVSLFAAEPDVAHPIALAFDARGRLWVAEGFSYPGPNGPWKSPVKDRILIFEDTDNDGRFDKRTVFSDQVRNVTSILPGFGGVFVCSTPNFIFIPDRNGDDV